MQSDNQIDSEVAEKNTGLAGDAHDHVKFSWKYEFGTLYEKIVNAR